MDKIALKLFDNSTGDLKVAVYNDDRTCKIYTHDEFDNIPVYAGQKIELLYNEKHVWDYDDKDHKTHHIEDWSASCTIMVPLSAKGTATLHIGDKYITLFMFMYGALGWIENALLDTNHNK